MESINLIILIFICYILGSIPFGYLLTKFFLKKDIRKIGSGNIGATNALRTGNKTLGYFTLILDISKAVIPILLIKNYFQEYIYISSLCVFLGHIFPIWLKFSGGKGVATYLGIILAISIKLGIIFCLSWLVILFLTRYSSLASVLSSLNIFLFSLYSDSIDFDFIYLTFFVIIIFTHRENLIRLKNASEDKIKF